jgi:ribosome biogenesis protein ERB1
VCIWEVETGRCLRVWDVGEAVQRVAWNPLNLICGTTLLK